MPNKTDPGKALSKRRAQDVVLIQLCSKRPSDVWRGMEQARQWLKENPEARDVYGLLLGAVQQNRELKEQVRNLLSEMMQRGSKAAEQAMLLLPSSEQEFLADADDAYYVENYAQAIQLYKQVLSLNPDNKRASDQLIKAQLSLLAGDKKKGVPARASKLYRQARSHLAVRNFDGAIQLVSAAIEITRNAGVSFPEAEDLVSQLNELLNFSRWKVFISYSRSDIGVASEIYEYLSYKGFNVWMDKFSLVSGQEWKLEIHNNIKSSDFFIACLSENSVSKRGYIQKELKEAISVLDEMPEGEIYIIPVRIDDCELPSSLTDRHWLDWSAPNAKEKLLIALNSKR